MTRRTLLALAALPALPARGAGNEPIPNGVVRADQVRLSKVPAGESAMYYDGHTGQLQVLNAGLWRVKPGDSPHGVHQHPEEELLVFSQGTGEVSISGTRYAVAPGSMLYCAANLPHGVYNTGSTEMVFYFIKWRA